MRGDEGVHKAEVREYKELDGVSKLHDDSPD